MQVICTRDSAKVLNPSLCLDRIFWKNLLENKEMVFKNGVKNIQAVGYNGARRLIYKPFNISKNKKILMVPTLYLLSKFVSLDVVSVQST